jgi:hypothetical protein
MICINPLAYYQIHEPDKIPDLTPRDNKEVRGCLSIACGWIISTIIYVFLFYLCFTHTEGILRSILVMIDSAVIYPLLIIYLVELSVKIGEKIYKKKRR